jgi:5-enolpyruvylshikimate-3-phosphate synthase
MAIVVTVEVTVLRGVPSLTMMRLAARRARLVAGWRYRLRSRVAKRASRVFTIAALRGADAEMSLKDSAVFAVAQGLVTCGQFDEVTADATPADWDLANALIAVEMEIRSRQVEAMERALSWPRLAQFWGPGVPLDPTDKEAVCELVRHAPDLALAGVLCSPQPDPTMEMSRR